MIKCDQEVTAVRQRIKFKTEQKGHTDIGTSDVKVEMEQEQADMNIGILINSINTRTLGHSCTMIYNTLKV
jgi:hypothetical protein